MWTISKSESIIHLLLGELQVFGCFVGYLKMLHELQA
jgi:hypothetical protein